MKVQKKKKHIRQRVESKNAWSICLFKQSLKEEKLQLMNRSFIPFKGACIPFPPNEPHKTMKKHSPKHLSFDSNKLAWPTCYKFHNTTRHDPIKPQIVNTPYSTTRATGQCRSKRLMVSLFHLHMQHFRLLKLSMVKIFPNTAFQIKELLRRLLFSLY